MLLCGIPGSRFLLSCSPGQVVSSGDSILFTAGVFPTDIICSEKYDLFSGGYYCNGRSKQFSRVAAGECMAPSLPELSCIRFPIPLIRWPFDSRNDSVTNLLVSYPDDQKLAYISIAFNGSLNEAIIPSEGKPEFLSVKNKSFKNDNVISLNMQSPAIAASLSFYERLEPSEFIERTFRLSSPAVLLGAAVDDLNRDSIPDIVYAYRSTDTAAVELGVALGDSALTHASSNCPAEFSSSGDRHDRSLADTSFAP